VGLGFSLLLYRRELNSHLPAGLASTELPLQREPSPPAGIFFCAGGKLDGMKLQFSLATLLVCMTVLAVLAASPQIPVASEYSVRRMLQPRYFRKCDAKNSAMRLLT
jgi:hypothetical protein